MYMNCCNLMIKREWTRSCFLRIRKWFLEMESICDEDVVNTVEITMKDIEYDKNLVDKARTTNERTDSDCEGSSPVGKML